MRKSSQHPTCCHTHLLGCKPAFSFTLLQVFDSFETGLWLYRVRLFKRFLFTNAGPHTEPCTPFMSWSHSNFFRQSVLANEPPLYMPRRKLSIQYSLKLSLSTYNPTVFSCKFKDFVHRNTHTHPFNSPFSGTTKVSRYQKGKTNLDFTEARDSEWQWHQLGHVQVCTSLQRQPCQHPTTQFFTGWMPFLPPNQQRQSTEGSQHFFHRKQTKFLHWVFEFNQSSELLVFAIFSPCYSLKCVTITKVDDIEVLQNI